MNRRQQGLIALLFFVAGMATYLYWDTLAGGWSQWWARERPTVTSSRLPPDRADAVLQQSYRHFRRTLLRSLNMPDFYDTLRERYRGVRYAIDLETDFGRPGEGKAAVRNLRMFLAGVHTFGDTRAGRLVARSGARTTGDTLVIRYRKRSVQLVFPDDHAVYSVSPGEDESSSPGLMSEAPRLKRDTVALENWRGMRVIRATWTGNESRRFTLFVDPSSPHAMMGSRLQSRTRRVEHRITYRDETHRRHFRRVRTRMDGNVTATLTFRYRRDRLSQLRLEAPGSENLDWVRMDVRHVGNHSRGGTVTVRSPWTAGSVTLGTLEWRFRGEKPVSFSVDFDPPRPGPSARRRVRLDVREMEWLEESPVVRLVEEAQYERLSRGAAMVRIVNWLGVGGLTKGLEALTGSDGSPDTLPGAALRDRPTAREETDGHGPASEQSPQAQSSDTPAASGRKGSPTAPRNSGEEVAFSPIGQFPFSRPPPGYREARRAYQDGNYRKARRRLDGLLDRYPNSVHANFLMGVIHFDSGRFKTARTYFRRARRLRHDPQIAAWSREYLHRLREEDGSNSTRQ